MLNKLAVANSLAVLNAMVYVFFVIVGLISTRAFSILFDAQFLGANVASQRSSRLPRRS